MSEKMFQKRMTYLDTLNAQIKMRKKVKDLMEEDRILSDGEKREWERLVAFSFLSQGKNVKMWYDIPGAKIELGTVHEVAYKMLDWEEPIVVKDKGFKITFRPKVLWGLFYKKLGEIFPKALDEAIHMSAEKEMRDAATSFDFNSNEELPR